MQPAVALQTVQSLSEACAADLVIEAVPEQIELKKSLFAEIDRAAPANAFLASNTSGLDIDQLAAATERAERVIGMHFFNPPPRMPLVEIARGKATSDATFDAVHKLAQQLGKTPISVSNSPGFAVNRILFPMINEAIYALAEGVASAKDIDRAMCLGADHPLGPLALADFVGLDITLDILDALERDLESDKYRACPLLRDKVARGELGRKTGRGFFLIPDPYRALSASHMRRRLVPIGLRLRAFCTALFHGKNAAGFRRARIGNAPAGRRPAPAKDRRKVYRHTLQMGRHYAQWHGLFGLYSRRLPRNLRH